MKVDIEDGRLIVTPITEEDSRIIYALAAAYAAFDAVCYPIMGEAVRCTEGDSAQSSDDLQKAEMGNLDDRRLARRGPRGSRPPHDLHAVRLLRARALLRPGACRGSNPMDQREPPQLTDITGGNYGNRTDALSAPVHCGVRRSAPQISDEHTHGREGRWLSYGRHPL